jgi:hypothetical protein
VDLFVSFYEEDFFLEFLYLSAVLLDLLDCGLIALFRVAFLFFLAGCGLGGRGLALRGVEAMFAH